MDDKKKKFIVPDAELVDFANDDIITLSALGTGNSDWNLDDNTETFETEVF